MYQLTFSFQPSLFIYKLFKPNDKQRDRMEKETRLAFCPRRGKGSTLPFTVYKRLHGYYTRIQCMSTALGWTRDDIKMLMVGGTEAFRDQFVEQLV